MDKEGERRKNQVAVGGKNKGQLLPPSENFGQG